MASGGWPERGGEPAPPPTPHAAPWPGAAPPAAPPPSGSRWAWLDLKLVIVVMIGVVSVTGAVLTWQASQLGEYATDKDRQSLAETVQEQQDAAATAAQVDNEVEAFARYQEELATAEQLELQAETLRGQGRVEDAVAAEDEATERRELADSLASLTFNLAYVVEDPNTGTLTFDEEQRTEDLTRQRNAAFPADPEQTADEADDLRDRSQRLVGWIIPLVLAILLFTVAQLVASRRLRPAIAGAGFVVYLGATLIAFVGN